MTMERIGLTALIAAGLVLAGPAAAQTEREHGAHEHGVATLNLVVEGNELEIELELPGVDVVGFEHEAETAEDKAAIENGLKTLRMADTLFTLPAAAKCSLESAEAEAEHMEEEHGDHKSGSHGHGHSDEEKEEHAGFEAHYHFDCAAPDALDSVTVTLFDVFPSLESIHARTVTPGGQGAATLTSDARRLTLR